MKSSKKNNNSNNVLLALMFIIIIALLIYIIFFTKTGEKSDFYKDAIELQGKLSYYLGSTSSDMFGAYDIENILTGVNSDGEEIKDISDETLTAIVDKDSVQEEDEVKIYKLNEENVKSLINYELPTYDNIEWYITSNGILKVKISGTTPNWWSESLDSMKI